VAVGHVDVAWTAIGPKAHLIAVRIANQAVADGDWAAICHVTRWPGMIANRVSSVGTANNGVSSHSGMSSAYGMVKGGYWMGTGSSWPFSGSGYASRLSNSAGRNGL